MVDPELFARYQRALGANADLASKDVEALLSELAGLSPGQQARLLLEGYPKIVQDYGKAAADVARQYYQDSRDAYFGEDGEADEYVAQAAPPIRASWAEEDVSKATREGVSRLPDMATRRVMQRADQTIAYNVARDPARGMWAIVPHPGACGWCVMVASNGWSYSERSVNAQRHDGCKCSVAVDFDRDSPELAGYDPDALRRAYADARSTVYDDAEDAWWNRMAPEERARYGRKGRSAHDVYLTRLVAEEMNRRDGQWLQNQVPRYRTREPGARPLKKERDVGTALLGHGFDVKFARETPPTKRFDAWLNGVPWEFKVPEAYGKKTMKNQFKNALGKGTDKVLVSATINQASIESMIDDVRRMFNEGEFQEIKEVLLVSSDGERIVRMKRPLPHS